MRTTMMATVFAGAVLAASPATAVKRIELGTASVASLFTPAVVTSTNPATVSPGPGPNTFGGNNSLVIMGMGGFASASGRQGLMSGTVNFSKTVNTGNPLAVSLADFFVFQNSRGGTFNFSATSVATTAYQIGSRSSAITLYFLGSTIAADRAATDTSLTLTLNRTRNSAWSASATLAVLPGQAPFVPEPATWAMMVGGFGMMGFAMRRRRTAIRFG
jgi:hypothetical protein